MPANLRDVAAHAGVSIRTVSNVVNDFVHVAPQTRARVQRSIAEVGYAPNLAARQLRRGRTGMIGLIVPEIASPYFAELASAVVSAAEARGWTMLVDESGGQPERERRLLDGNPSRLVDGLVLSPWSLTPRTIAQRASTVPLVLLGERSADGIADRVAVDSVAAARQATEHLASIGRRRIAAIGAQPHLRNATARLRLQGYRAGLTGAGLAPSRRLEVPVRALHRADGVTAMARLLDAGAAPDAVFAFSDQLALGAMRLLADRGLHVPDDVAVIGFDDIEDGAYAVPSLSTIAPDKQQIAHEALACLAGRLDDPARPARDVVAAHRLIPRQSTGG